jgi:hypothetical protein
MWNYLAKVKEYCFNAKNAGVLEGALVCKCFGVDELMSEGAVGNDRLATTIKQVTDYSQAGGGGLAYSEALKEELLQVHAAIVAKGLAPAKEACTSGTTDVGAIEKKRQELVEATGLALRVIAGG